MSADAGAALARKDTREREQRARTCETHPHFQDVMTAGADARIAWTVSA
jgi:hypothetical protein